MPLDILFEDDALIFVNKPAGVVVQPRTDHPDEPYLHADVARHTSPAYLMQRLDRGTSGVMFFSKRADVNARLTRQFKLKRIRKRYLAVCEGYLAERRTVDAPLARVDQKEGETETKAYYYHTDQIGNPDCFAWQ